METIKQIKISVESVFFILLVVGFMVISSLPYLFSVESRYVTISYRALVLGISIYIIINDILKYKALKFNRLNFCFLFFWALYLLNVYLSFRNYTFMDGVITREYEIYVRIIGICMIPSFALLLIPKNKFNYSIIFKVAYFLAFFVLLINVLIGIKYNFQGRSSGIMATYSIDFGHYGVTLSILSLYYLIFREKRSSLKTLITGIGFFIGTYILYASASRGPLVAFVVVVLLMLFLAKKYKFLAIFISLLFMGILYVIFFDPNKNINEVNGFVSRVSSMILSGDSSGRGKLYYDSLIIFIENPIFGGRFMFEDGLYVHNLFLDILMSMGIFGMFFFVYYFKNAVFEFIKIFDEKYIQQNNHLWIHFLFIQYLLFVFLSSTLYDTPEFWYLLVMMVVIYNDKKVEKI